MYSTKKLPISAFIIAQDEEDRIAAAIESLQGFVEEVIVIDSGSSDNTVKLCESLGAKVFYNKWPGYGLQKRFGESKCRNNWVINLDADERLSPELAREIRELFASGAPSPHGYRTKIVEVLPNQQIMRFARKYNVVRLYDLEQARYHTSPVHDRVVIDDNRVEQLRGEILHQSIRNISHYIAKTNRYTDELIDDAVANNRSYGTWRVFAEFPISLFKAYILRRYCLQGVYGFILAMNFASMRFLKMAKAYERQKILVNEK